MSLTCTRNYGISVMVAAGLITTLAAPAAAQDTPPTVTVSAGIDVVNQYQFRGIRQNGTGVATWPYFDLSIGAFEGEGGLKSVGINVGTWNSAHSRPGGWY